MVNRQAYMLEKAISNKQMAVPEEGEMEKLIQTLERVKESLYSTITVLTSGENLFVPRQDEKMIKKMGDQRIKQLEGLQVKLAGLYPKP